MPTRHDGGVPVVGHADHTLITVHLDACEDAQGGGTDAALEAIEVVARWKGGVKNTVIHASCIMH